MSQETGYITATHLTYDFGLIPNGDFEDGDESPYPGWDVGGDAYAGNASIWGVGVETGFGTFIPHSGDYAMMLYPVSGES